MAGPRPMNGGKNIIQLDGQVFGRLTVIGRAKNIGEQTAWNCRCSCGAEKTVMSSKLRSGETRSCGCLRREVSIERMSIHSHSRKGRRSTEYNSWRAMLQRCGNPNYREYRYYGGAGVSVCDRWTSSFENFLADMGMKPHSKHSIDRIDPSGNYEPSNCRWADSLTQRLNRRVK